MKVCDLLEDLSKGLPGLIHVVACKESFPLGLLEEFYERLLVIAFARYVLLLELSPPLVSLCCRSS